MIVIRGPVDAERVQHSEIRTLMLRRFAMLTEEEPFDADTMGYFVAVEVGDSAETVSAQLGFDILANRYTGTRFDQPGFDRSFEILEEHRTCFEIVFVISDDGFGVEVFVPKEEGVDADLLAMCSMYSVPSQEPIP